MKPLSLRAGMSESGVRDLFRNQSSPRAANAIALARALGRTVDEIAEIGRTGVVVPRDRPPAVPVLARVGAGAEVRPIAEFAPGEGLYRVERPPQLAGRDVAAVEVLGDSMAPLAPESSVLFYARAVHGVPTEALGQICVCEDEDGRGWVKVVQASRERAGRFNLISLKEGIPLQAQVALRWAAPVLLTLRPEFVTRLE